ncbi:hypothetical protein [Vibrio cyclitrophicus]|uniref:hypothetical protein n=1 Tax=Vibrio cyclitrophicus TaxID=47951 RepID=UPI000C82A69E|nr:hypothetical protein [Vibrio cyclitrophicus]PMH75159.1 hypothetical protein BCU59_18180 [Vibrio cyclitrophicus]
MFLMENRYLLANSITVFLIVLSSHNVCAETVIKGDSLASMSVNGVKLGQVYKGGEGVNASQFGSILHYHCDKYRYRSIGSLPINTEERQNLDKNMNSIRKKAYNYGPIRYRQHDGNSEMTVYTSSPSNTVVAVGFAKVYNRPEKDLKPALEKQFNFKIENIEPKSAGNRIGWISHNGDNRKIKELKKFLHASSGEVHDAFTYDFKRIMEEGYSKSAISNYTLVRIDALSQTTFVAVDTVGDLEPIMKNASIWFEQCKSVVDDTVTIINKRLEEKVTL